ncbi:MAG TPA: isoprenyl transferase [Bacteroidales bacterium]|jgi:undecaprenyl diphosphate synthase|nr:isoprenyl transferase [Bacteroidales bacterium]NLH33696.1 isoprenyl transferase [Lentimicrobium sp.]OQC38105.1 MAG: Ditrans,polycis-undecaprenyl-diphosphate synthase ((2E,6E)-farnesyl-diphosphate specific) [Bacteroidetes bacterium ADurb.Bin041]MBP7874035.1 isoprenyl transferase [Bacteroidales bacterium]MCZ2281787.1 isoprenyl transferase [Bacteroidales bacterium]
MGFKDKIDMKRLPRHIAIIMDGNGRWAKQRGLVRTVGHENGIVAVREVAEAAAELGIEYLTLYAFSVENWKRPQREVEILMKLLLKTIDSEMKTLKENDIRLLAIGNLISLQKKTYERLLWAIEETKNHKRMNLVLALSYSSHYEIVEAVKEIARKAKQNELSPEDINESVISNHLFTKGFPDPELLIRTSGEFRISNFLLWQLAYSEIYITPILWPDFRKENFYEAIVNFQKRERRFGKTSEQVSENANKMK